MWGWGAGADPREGADPRSRERPGGGGESPAPRRPPSRHLAGWRGMALGVPGGGGHCPGQGRASSRWTGQAVLTVDLPRPAPSRPPCPSLPCPPLSTFSPWSALLISPLSCLETRLQFKPVEDLLRGSLPSSSVRASVLVSGSPLLDPGGGGG